MNEVITFLVNTLGRGEEISENGVWPANYITEAAKIKLMKGASTSTINRGVTAIMIHNALDIETWEVSSENADGQKVYEESETLRELYF